VTLAAHLDAMKSDPVLERDGDAYPRLDPLALLRHLGRIPGVTVWTHWSGVIQTLEAPDPLHVAFLEPRDAFCRYRLMGPDGEWRPGHGHIELRRIEKICVEIHPDDCMPAAYVVTFHGLRMPAHLLTVGLPVWYDPRDKARPVFNDDALAIFRFLRERLGTGVLRLGGRWYAADADLHGLATQRYEQVFKGA